MITKGKVVSLAYCLKNSDGEVLDEGDHRDPFAYIHGMQQIVPGLESALEGLAIGAKKSVEVAPKEAYGEYNANLLVTVARAQLPPNIPLKAGMQLEGSTESGHPMVYTIQSIEGDSITMDGNHPLAGQTLFFDIEVLDIRDASAEEISHGHVHGAGGHYH